jgi:hypothetical protein
LPTKYLFHTRRFNMNPRILGANGKHANHYTTEDDILFVSASAECEKNCDKYQHNFWSPNLDSNHRPAEHEARVLTISATLSLKIHRNVQQATEKQLRGRVREFRAVCNSDHCQPSEVGRIGHIWCMQASSGKWRKYVRIEKLRIGSGLVCWSFSRFSQFYSNKPTQVIAW